jgi:predicted outer membrane repeat protein
MFLTRWLKSVPRTRRALERPRFRPTVEGLEARDVPAILTVTTTADLIDPNDGILSLREAVVQANATNGADKIVMPAGAYALMNGHLELASNISIIGAGAELTTIDGLNSSAHAGASGVFDVLSGANALISGMTIQNGSGPAGAIYNVGDLSMNACVLSGNTGAWLSGGIYNRGTLLLNACTFSGNSVASLGQGGGAITNEGGSLTLNACTISGNTAVNHGGAILNNSGTLTVRDSTFWDNSATRGEGGAVEGNGDMSIANSTFTNNRSVSQSGGAVHSSGNLTVRGCTLANNLAYQAGGAICIDPHSSATVTIGDSTFSGNSAGVRGGAFAVYSSYYGTDLAGSLTMANCNFTGNSAAWGGAVYNGDNAYSVTVRGSNFFDNSAVDPNGNRGGGVYNEGALTIQECMFTGNHSGFGGAVYNQAGTCTIIKCTITNNIAGGIYGGGDGGGIANFGTLIVRDSTVINNTAPLGGDLYNAGLVYLFDSTVNDRYDA